MTLIACNSTDLEPVTPYGAYQLGAAFCITRGIVPVVCRDNCLVLALWRPQDLAAAAEVEQVTHLQVLPVLTTRREIEERIRLLYMETERELKQAA